MTNIVLILADDLGYGDVSCLNAESRIQTPRMDGLAKEGMTFTDAHSSSAVCTPTRYATLTGRYCWRGRLKSGVLFGYDAPLIEPGRATMASMLRRAGYRTACIGKWHLGLGWSRTGPTPEDVDFGKPLDAGPHTVGFDHSFIIPASLDMTPYCYVANGRVVELPTGQIADSERPAMWRGGAIAPGFTHEGCLPRLVHEAERFIADHGVHHRDKPFFLYFPTPSPHTPHVPTAAFQGRSHAGVYGDFVMEHDWAVGRILDALQAAGVADDTMVIVTSDNGAHMRGGDFDFEREFGHRSNHIYRGQKSDAWDGGHRVPTFVRWPGKVEAGALCDETICLNDFFATAAEMAGVVRGADEGPDSVSLLPLLRGGKAPQREAIVHHSIDGRFAIRHGPWKLIECRGSGGWSEPESKVGADAPAMQLYHVTDDPGETTNLIEREPGVAREMLAALDAIRSAAR